MTAPRPTPTAVRSATLAVLLLAGAASACSGGPGGSGDAAKVEPSTTTGSAVATTAVAPSTSAAPGSTAVRTTVAPGRPATPSTTLAPDGGIRSVDWANRTYPGDTCATFGPGAPRTDDIVVRDGRSGTPESGGMDAGEGVVYGELTGDHWDEAVVPVHCRTGGSHNWSQVWLYTDDVTAPGGVRRLGEVRVDNPGGPTIDARHFATATIEGGRLTTTWLTYDGDDPNNAPSLLTTLHQRWNGSALVNDGPPVVGPAPAPAN